MFFRAAKRKPEPEAWKGLCAGLAGGMVGTLVMTGAQTGMGRLMSIVERRKRGDGEGEEAGWEKKPEPATVQAASAISQKVFHCELAGGAKQVAGQAVHYGFGTTVGLAYGLAAEYRPKITRGMGLPFGTGLMVAADEIAVPALRLSAPPTRQPASTHLYAVAAHLAYGLACELTRRQVRRLLH